MDRTRTIATAHDVAPSQVALAWLLAQGPDVVPIPGTKRHSYLEENAAAVDVELTPADLEELATLRPTGDRYADMSWVQRDAPVAG